MPAGRKYFTLILKMKILIIYTGKFCYRYGNFQNTEAVTGGVLKSFTKFTKRHLCQSMPQSCNFIKKRLQHRCFPVNFVKFLRTPFFASDCFSKYESLYMVAPIHTCLIKSCSENVWKISRNVEKTSRSKSASDFNFSVTSSVKLKTG